MRIIIFLLFTFLLAQPALSQPPTQAQMNAKMQEVKNKISNQIAEVEKQIATAKTENPEKVKSLEEKLAMLKQQLAMMEGVNNGLKQTPESVKSQFENRNESASTGFPEKKTALLNALPKRTLTEQELIAFLLAFHNELKKKSDPEKVQGVLNIIIKCEKNNAKIAMAGVAAWYNNAPSESVLLLTYAGYRSPDDLTLNNCGAILNLYGREEKALPVLKYVLPHQPDNCTLLNNIGQAFAGLGEKDSAMFYFALVLRRCGSHPEANATAAHIALSNGDKALAASYMERSLQGAYSKENMDILKAIKPNYKPAIQLDTKSYFEKNGFTPAPNCSNWSECEKVTAIQQATRKFLDDQRTKFENIVRQNMEANITLSQQGKSWKEGPLAKKAQYLKEVITDAYIEPRTKASEELLQQIFRIGNRQKEEVMALDKEFEPQYKACEGVGGNCIKNALYRYCLRKEALDNKYFALVADAAETFESVWYPKDVKYYDNMMYLISINAINDMVRKAECATFTNYLIDKIRIFVLSECPPPNKPDCVAPPPSVAQELLFPVFKQGECPIDIRIPCIVGHISLNCERFELEGGEGIVFKYEKNFKNKESSFAVGVGVEAEIPGLNMLVDGSATAMVGFKFDSNNVTTDVFGTAKADVNVFGSGIPVIVGEATVGVSSGYKSSFKVMGR